MTSFKILILLFLWVFCLCISLVIAKDNNLINDVESEDDTNEIYRCGDKYGKCREGECCSKYGWCGKSDAYCDVDRGCQKEYGLCNEETMNTSEKSDDENEDVIYRCGDKFGNCREGECCSKYGWCGKTDDYCNIDKGCQSKFGVCNGSVKKEDDTKAAYNTNAKSYDKDIIYRCGDKYGNCRKGECCSKYGWCGKTRDYCSLSNGCQPKYGNCNNIRKTKKITKTVAKTVDNGTTQVEISEEETTPDENSNDETTTITTTTKTPTTTEPSTSITISTEPSTSITTTTEPSTSITTSTEPSTSITTSTEPSTSITTSTEPSTSITTSTEPSTSITTSTEPSTSITTSTEPPTTSTEPPISSTTETPFSTSTEPPTTTSTEPHTTTTNKPTCLGQTSLCDNQMGVRIDGQLYCYNTEEELLSRCREAIPGEMSCHPGEECVYASNDFGEDVPGNCNWGYFSQRDARDFCNGLGGRLLNENEMNDVWSAFTTCKPSMGKNGTCYWTSTSIDFDYQCRNNKKMNTTRKDGYSNAGGALCKMLSK